jgi:GWxTD domain-containing protein
MSAPSAKNFSISWPKARRRGRHSAAVCFAVAFLLIALPAAAKKKNKSSDPDDLFNPLLGIDYSHWLVGPIADVAAQEEIDAYLRLASDEEAAAFIESFWAKRAEGVGFFEKKPRQIFEERAEVADKRFSEGAFPGRRTDRGKTLILYGEPEEITFESPPDVGVPTLEVWKYPKDAALGLDGEAPQRSFRFVEIDGSTVLYTNQKVRRGPRDRTRDFGSWPRG